MDFAGRAQDRSERLLGALLRLMAAAEMLAAIGILMPRAQMAAWHARLGLGGFPEGALAPYLARHLAAMYCVHGGFLWMIARDVRRHDALLLYAAWSGIAFSALVTALDLWAGFPWYWWAAEGPGLAALSVTFLLLRAACRRSRPGSAGCGRS
ncbi:MAG: hypothetical protein FJ225_09200 [Lentisphaerae bacterium]|nr:hypothetical protein [Lentisphaerota bacterium]